MYYAFYMCVLTNSDYFPIHFWPVNICNVDSVFLIRIGVQSLSINYVNFRMISCVANMNFLQRRSGFVRDI